MQTLAVVGTPCQLTVLSALRRFPWRYRRTAERAVTLTIGLFCTRSFDPSALMRHVAVDGSAPREVQKVDVDDGRLVLRDGKGREVFARPVRDVRDATLRGCDECGDFTALASDIAIGSIGSGPGRSTVLVRTEAGLNAWLAASGSVQTTPLEDLQPVARIARLNRRRAERITPRPFDPGAPLWISYREHLAAYQGTTRAPVPPPAFRSHNYETGC